MSQAENKLNRLFWAAACSILGGLASTARAADQPAGIADFLSVNCTGCHVETTSEGDLDLESLTLKLYDPDNFHLWERVFDRVREGEMPPDETLDEKEVHHLMLNRNLPSF